MTKKESHLVYTQLKVIERLVETMLNPKTPSHRKGLAFESYQEYLWNAIQRYKRP